MAGKSTFAGSGARSTHGPRRAAELMVALGNERAAEVLSRLSDDQVSRLTWLVAHTEKLSSDQREDVLRDFYASLTSRDYASVGGPETVQRFLEAAFGDERAAELQMQLGSIGRPKPFKFLEQVSMTVLAEFLAAEHPQLVALIMTSMHQDQAAELLMLLPDGLQSDVLIRISHLDAPAPDVVELTDAIVQKRLAGAVFSTTESSVALGVDALIDLLRHVDVATQRLIIDGIGELDPAIGARVRQQMFVFDDLADLDERSLQRVIREIDQADLTLALRAADQSVRDVIFSNMSSRAASMIQDDIEVGGPVRLTVIHEAQNRIVMIVRDLQERDEIVINQAGDDELVA